MLHYLSTKWVEAKDLVIPVNDLSVLRGYGVFDFLRTYNHVPFRLEDHIDRFFNSLDVVGITPHWTKEEIMQKVIEGIEKNKPECKEFNIRIIGTGGVGPDSVTPGVSSLIITYTCAIEYPKEYYEEGVKVITYSTRRVLAEAKSLNYMMGILALQKAKKEEAVEAIYVDEGGKMYEGTTTNIFVVIDGKLVTPKVDILAGITRKVIFEIAQKEHISIEEKDIYMKGISSFREAFISASNKEIMPVVQIDDTKVAQGEVGHLTKKLMGEFRKITR
ncbi:MAG: aminotransferase class IV [bacterium]|nr:aminotransferase class IV [bacterium]